MVLTTEIEDRVNVDIRLKIGKLNQLLFRTSEWSNPVMHDAKVNTFRMFGHSLLVHT